jgi:glycosyltransferase involved in cell wall biosynthesis
MYVLQLSWEYPPHIVGGLGRHVAELSPALARAGARVSVVTPHLRDGAFASTRRPRMHVLRVPPPVMAGYDFPTFVAQTGRALEQAAIALVGSGRRPDIVHAHDWLTAEAAIALKHRWRVPLLATIHATERGRGRGGLDGNGAQAINDIEWRLSYEAWRVIVCSRFMAGQIADYFSAPADKIDVVANGVRVTRGPFDGPAERAAFRARFVGPDEARVFSVGRVVFEKGLHVLVEAWRTVAAAAPARLVIAGTGEYLEQLKAQAAALGLDGRILFTGFIDDADRDRLYHAADVAVFPSLYEPFGIVALEACAARCPVVVSAAGGLAEVIDLGVTGLVVPVGDSPALAESVLACLRDPAGAQARAELALRMVRSRYTWGQIAAATMAVYRRVLAEWHASPWGKEITTI